MENSWEEKRSHLIFFNDFLWLQSFRQYLQSSFSSFAYVFRSRCCRERKRVIKCNSFSEWRKKSTDKLLENNKNTISSLQTKLKERDKEIKSLESQLENSENRFQSANSEKEKLQSELQSLQSAQEETKKAMNEIVKTYETMSPKNAAAILSEMSEKEAMKILGELKPAKLASVLEKMEPAVASKYTELLSKSAKASQ